jgi:hypothetical protein
LLTLLFAITAQAGDPFAGVNEDVFNAFVGSQWRTEADRYSTAIPEGFTLPAMPSGFSLVGSRISQVPPTGNEASVRTTTVVYSTSDAAHDAHAAALAIMTDAGWRDTGVGSHSGGGFQRAPQPINALLCGPSADGTMSVFTIAKVGKTYVYFTGYPGTFGQQCSAGATAGPPPAFRADSREIPMPVLRLPDDARASRHGQSGSDRQRSSHVVVEKVADREALEGFLERQLREQGWQFQGGWSGERAAGSSWVRADDDGSVAVGSLHLIVGADKAVHLSLTVTTPGPDGGGQQLQSFSIGQIYP